jgi:hypothetical protein
MVAASHFASLFASKLSIEVGHRLGLDRKRQKRWSTVILLNVRGAHLFSFLLIGFDTEWFSVLPCTVDEGEVLPGKSHNNFVRMFSIFHTVFCDECGKVEFHMLRLFLANNLRSLYEEFADEDIARFGDSPLFAMIPATGFTDTKTKVGSKVGSILKSIIG